VIVIAAADEFVNLHEPAVIGQVPAFDVTETVVTVCDTIGAAMEPLGTVSAPENVGEASGALAARSVVRFVT